MNQLRPQYTFEFCVRFPNGENLVYAIDVPEREAEQFRPIDRCDDTFTAWLARGETPQQANRTDASRKVMAAMVARSLTDAIMKALASRDRHNGFAQEGGK